MIDWGARIDELAFALQRQHAIEDRLALEVLLSALIECPRTPAVWIMLETKWLERECKDAWFAFGDTWTPNSFARLRAKGYWHTIEAQFVEWLEDPNVPRLFVEPDYEKYKKFGKLPHARFVLERVLRVRMFNQRTACVLQELDLANLERRQSELGAYARVAIEDPAKIRAADPPRFVEPPDFLYYLELVQKLAPYYADWRVLLRNFAALAVRHAYLFDRRETGPEENAILARVAADMVPFWVTNAMRLVLREETVTMKRLGESMVLEEIANKAHLAGPHYEAKRLRRNGILDLKARGAWFLVERHRAGIEKLLDGCAFGATKLDQAASLVPRSKPLPAKVQPSFHLPGVEPVARVARRQPL